MAPLYRLEAIRMAFGDRTVLDVPELALEEGRRYTLAGPNGAGKSTLLSLLAFLFPPAAGTLHYDGRPVRWSQGELTRLRRETALLHQSPYLFNATVADNVAYGVEARGIRGPLRRRRVASALEAVGLADFAHRGARALSGGEAQRVAMARVLAAAPRTLLLDEPLANVDRATSETLRRVVASLPGQGVTVVVATHDPAPPGTEPDQVILLDRGRLGAIL